MPLRPAVESLPEDIKSWLDQELIRRGFAGYEALSALLAERGYAISKSSLHRYGSAFEERLAALKVATQQAKAIAESAGDDEGALNDALIRLIQEKAFSALVEMEEAGELSLIDIGHMAAKLGQAAVAQKKWQAELKRRAEAAAKNVEKVARKSDLSDEAVESIRREILGVAG